MGLRTEGVAGHLMRGRTAFEFEVRFNRSLLSAGKLMKTTFAALVTLCLLLAAPSASADLAIRLFRTGDASKSSFFTVRPGEVFTVDAEISSDGTDNLNTYFAQFSSTPTVGGSAMTFTDQSGVAPYRNSASGYVFGDNAEIATPGIPPTPDGVTIPDPFTAVYDASLVAGVTPVMGVPFLLARMQFVADAAAVIGDQSFITLDDDPAAATFFTDDIGNPLNIGSITGVTVTAVPEPSSIVLATLLIGGFGLSRLRRRRQQSPSVETSANAV